MHTVTHCLQKTLGNFNNPEKNIVKREIFKAQNFSQMALQLQCHENKFHEFPNTHIELHKGYRFVFTICLPLVELVKFFGLEILR